MSGSGFSTLNTALTGLAAAQRALDVTSQNIVNANTPGYSRQRVLLGSVGAAGTATFHTGTGLVIGGVRVEDVSRIHDAFLEATRAAAGAKQSGIDSQLDILGSAQTLLSEPGEVGLQSTLDSFYSSWHDLSNNPSDTAAGSVVIQRGVGVTEALRAVSNGLAAQWTTARNNLSQTLVEANQAASDLARLNGEIRQAQTAQQPVNELLDTRDTLVRKLASQLGASASVDSNGLVSLGVGGVSLVSGTQYQTIMLAGGNDISTAVSDPAGLSIGPYAVPIASGSVAGLLATMRADLPSLSAKVDSVATAVISAVNSVYQNGYAPDGSTAKAFFSGTGAADIAVVPVNSTELAIAAAPDTNDGSVALKIGDLANDATSAAALGGPGASAQWRQLTGALGVQVQSLTTAQSVQEAVVSAADDAVVSDSGVNLDEEMTNMMLYQRSYQASARVITTTDDILDTLINRTGITR